MKPWAESTVIAVVSALVVLSSTPGCAPQDGGVFTFGSSQYGQLGHNSTQPSSYPKKVFELMGSVVSQLTCGR